MKVSHLLLVDDLKLYAKNEKSPDSLIQTVRIFSKDIGMEFGIGKYAMLSLKRGNKVASDGIKLPDTTLYKSVKDEKATNIWEFFKQTLCSVVVLRELSLYKSCKTGLLESLPVALMTHLLSPYAKILAGCPSKK